MQLAQETPVALVFNGETQAVLMATPDALHDLAIGFAISDGLVRDLSEIEDIQTCEQRNGIEVQVTLNIAASHNLTSRRRARSGPVGCGLCGADSLNQALPALPQITSPAPSFTDAALARALKQLQAGQALHRATHAVHAACFVSPDGAIAHLREDVGRHNALDKTIGALAQAGTSARIGAALITSRVSVDIIQKLAHAGIPALAAVSAPTALAVESAASCGVTLITNLKDGSGTRYPTTNKASDVA